MQSGIVLRILRPPVVGSHVDKQDQWQYRVAVVLCVLSCYLVVDVPLRACFDEWATWPALAVSWLVEALLVGGLIRSAVFRHVRPHPVGLAVDILAVLPLELFSLAISDPRGPVHPALRLNRLLWFRVLFRQSGLVEVNPRWPAKVLRLLRLSCLLLLLVHWFAGLWYLTVRSEADDSPLAVAEWTMHDNLVDEPFRYRYGLACYWSITMLTGYGMILPITDAQTVYALFVAMGGVCVYVVAIGTVGSLVTNLDFAEGEFRRRLNAVSDYVRYRRAGARMAERVRDYYNYIWITRGGIDESALLNDLPRYLQEEVALYVNRDAIARVPIFKDCSAQFMRCAAVSLRPLVVMAGSWVIRKGEVGREMYFISRGEVDVVSEDGGTVFATLRDGAFFGEVALVHPSNRRTASVRARKFCDLFVLTKEDFDHLRESFPEESRAIRRAAHKRWKLAQENEEFQRAATENSQNEGTTEEGAAPNGSR